jgi:cell division protein FtsW (lipid II flippase)
MALSVLLAGAAVLDQIGTSTLTEHATAVYASSGTQPEPALLYGLVYTVAVVGAVLWLAVVRALRSRRRWAPGLTVLVVTITAALAVLLLAATEYGARIFPPLWGLLALLPSAAGIAVVVLLLRRRHVGHESRPD